MSMAIVKRADKRRFGNMQIQLQNSFLIGNNDYPTTVPQVLKLLNKYALEWRNGVNPNKQNNPHRPSTTHSNQNPTSNGISFLQSSGTQVRIPFLRGSNGSFFPNITCRLCGMKGHYQSFCPVVVNENGHRFRRNNDSPTPTNSTATTNATLSTMDGGTGDVRMDYIGYQLN